MHEQSDSKKGLLSPQEQKINKKVKKMPKEKNKLIETKTHWSQGRLSQPFPMLCFLLCLVQPCFASHVVSPRVCHMETPTVSFDNYTGPVWGPPGCDSGCDSLVAMAANVESCACSAVCQQRLRPAIPLQEMGGMDAMCCNHRLVLCLSMGTCGCALFGFCFMLPISRLFLKERNELWKEKVVGILKKKTLARGRGFCDVGK